MQGTERTDRLMKAASYRTRDSGVHFAGCQPDSRLTGPTVDQVNLAAWRRKQGDGDVSHEAYLLARDLHDEQTGSWSAFCRQASAESAAV